MALRLPASCPGCGAPVAPDAVDTAVLCDRCGSAHLLLRSDGTASLELASRTDPDEAAALARTALADEMARRGRGGPTPVCGEPVPLFSPVRVLVARLHEAAVVRGPGGDPASEVTARLVESAQSALHEPLGLATAPPLADVDARALSPVRRRLVPAPAFAADASAYGADAARLEGVRAGAAPALARRATAVPLARLLLLRPCRLLPVSSGSTRASVLVDEAMRQATALLSPSAADALLGAVEERPLPQGGTPALRPMRCPDCASTFPMDRQGQLRICPGCRRAYLVSGRRLAAVSYTAELPSSPRGRLLVPAWRFPFVLTDPRDGVELADLAAVRARCGGERRGDAGVRGDLDVPAFLPSDSRRERPGAQPLPVLPPSTLPLFEGPARAEAGFPDVRPVGALGPAEAAAVARHALLASLPPAIVARAAPRLLKSLLLEAPLRLGAPRLVLRAVRRAEIEGSP